MSRILLILIVFILSVSSCYSDNTELNKILNGVLRQQNKMEKQIQDAIYDGQFSFVETNDKRETTKSITAVRKIYSKGLDKQKGEYLEMTIDGKKLNQTELAKENKKSQSGWKTNLPFSKEFRNNYDYNYVSEDSWDGFKLWKIGFAPKRKNKGYIQGFAYISQADSNIIQYQFVSVGLPFVLKNFNIILDYSKVQGYWQLTKFSMQMEVDVKIIFPLSHKYIRMQETYSNYKINNNLPDSLFE